MERPDGSLICDARTPIGDLEKLLGLTLLPEDAEENIDTAGGLCFMLAGRIPAKGEIFEHPAGLTIEVLEADQRKIKRLRIRRAEDSKVD
jgi:CBS domain containing-hemolysin-like protein